MEKNDIRQNLPRFSGIFFHLGSERVWLNLNDDASWRKPTTQRHFDSPVAVRRIKLTVLMLSRWPCSVHPTQPFKAARTVQYSTVQYVRTDCRRWAIGRRSDVRFWTFGINRIKLNRRERETASSFILIQIYSTYNIRTVQYHTLLWIRSYQSGTTTKRITSY